jgi:predicted DCC family thiol-disulfide oxidoreductase YuxK
MSFPVVRFVFGGAENSGAGMGRPYTVVWDGSCKTCSRLVTLLDRWDTGRQIETIPSQNTSVFARFPWIPVEAYAEAVQLIGPDGQTWQGAAAVEKLLEVLPHGRLVGWVFNIPYMGRAMDRFYRWFARNRYRFGCGEHCQSRPLNVNYEE